MDNRFQIAVDEAPSLRTATFSDLEVGKVKDSLIFDGLAAVFDETTDLGEFTEEVRHGTYRKIIASGVNVPLVHEHDPGQLMGTTKSGRVRLAEETKGLRVQANVAITDLSLRIKSLVESGDITGMSHGFIAGRENCDWNMSRSKPHRVIKGLKALLDVCTTWDPAYASTEAQFRSLALAHPEAAGPLQQLLSGVYPQLEEPGSEAEIEAADEPEQGSEERTSGVGTPLLAARKRRLRLLSLSLEGGEKDAQ